jgi:prepilin-type processing-associated H-X9-DG protein
MLCGCTAHYVVGAAVLVDVVLNSCQPSDAIVREGEEGMGVDLTGGLSVDREFVFADQPADPDMRESVNVWLWDEGGDVGFPRIGVEAVADQWDTHDAQVNIAFADGRGLKLFVPGPVHDPLGSDGKPRILGAGPLSFELVEPFEHWRMRLAGDLAELSVERQMDGEFVTGPGPVPVELEVDIRSAVPPWENGALRAEAARVLEEQEEGALMGGPRFEQLFRMTGRLRVGDDERELRGGGLRIRRAGIRRLARFWGHLWQSSVFPSGKAYGCLVYPDRDDGLPTYNEGFLFDGDGPLVGARVVDAPWLRRMRPRGEQVEVVLETEDGRTETIGGETLVSSFAAIPVTEDTAFPVLHQSIVRYTWGGETANGMMERSSLPQDLDPT